MNPALKEILKRQIETLQRGLKEDLGLSNKKKINMKEKILLLKRTIKGKA